jgi:hypothetical protein
MNAGQRPWDSDHLFLTTAKRIITDAKASLILVTHPKKGAQGSGLDDLAGGATYQRFAQTVLWLEYVEAKEGFFKSSAGLVSESYNRILQIRKARESKGQGLKIGFWFNGETFKSIERGVLEK